MRKYGTRAEVFAGLAERTRGGKGLRREDLVMGVNGRIASRRLSEAAQRRWSAGGKEAFGLPPQGEPVPTLDTAAALDAALLTLRLDDEEAPDTREKEAAERR